jgi:hypothetical protein
MYNQMLTFHYRYKRPKPTLWNKGSPSEERTARSAGQVCRSTQSHRLALSAKTLYQQSMEEPGKHLACTLLATGSEEDVAKLAKSESELSQRKAFMHWSLSVEGGCRMGSNVQ